MRSRSGLGGEGGLENHSGCRGVSGNSGGPVLAQIDHTWNLIGVVNVRTQDGSLAAPVSDTLTELIHRSEAGH
ncbi:hypothetical protein ACIPLC_27370 [Kitasatospora sp. NPDC086801]|uniref:hypothetical protein n=1 Tax=Kitasatospora sp. NPDC086801 TaxID=3364066 RepID=UPI00380BCE9F